MGLKIGLGIHISAGKRLGKQKPKMEWDLSEYLAALTTSLPSVEAWKLNEFYLGIKQATNIDLLRDAFDAVYMLCGQTQEASLKNLVKRLHDATAVDNPTFVAGGGFTSNGTSSYVNTNYSPGIDGVAYQQNNASFGACSNTHLAQTNMFLGTRDNDNNSRSSLAMTSTSFQSAINHSPVNVNSAAQSSTIGMYVVSRNASNYNFVTQNGIVLGTFTTATTAVPRNPFYICCYNNGTAAQYFSYREMAFAFMGRALTETEIIGLNAAYNQYRLSA